MLYEFLIENRAELIARCRAKISSRPAPQPTDIELEHGVPLFLDQLVDTLRGALTANAAIDDSATRHGHELLVRGFTIAQVVHDYGGVCQAITELAGERNAPIEPGEFQVLNRCLDEAIAAAVTAYAKLRAREGTERLGMLAHELRNRLNTAILSSDMLKSGSVGWTGSTGAVLTRSLMGLKTLIDRELADVRISSENCQLGTLLIRDFVADIEVAAAMEATARGLTLSVVSVADDVAVNADEHILASVVSNLLQNAFKFTRKGGHVVLRVRATVERVLIDVEDQCGGLPPGKVGDLFQPFEQGGANRAGLGLGLSICERGARMNDGKLHVVDRPGTGCVFTLDLPRTLAK